MSQEAIGAALLVENKAKCNPPLEDAEVLGIVASVSRYAPGDPIMRQVKEPLSEQIETTFGKRDTQPWPDPLDEAAFYGLAGVFVRTIEPHTEADPVALLAQFLVSFGNIIGRSAYFVTEADKQFLNLFVVLVGMSAKGRKGTSWGYIRKVCNGAVDAFEKDRIASGLSSGEGLMYAVRDPQYESKPEMEKGKPTGKKFTVCVDDGVTDKRLIVVEPEFAQVLKVMAREGNTLSPIIRSIWDSGEE